LLATDPSFPLPFEDLFAGWAPLVQDFGDQWNQVHQIDHYDHTFNFPYRIPSPYFDHAITQNRGLPD
jgi:hypothetical protein